MFFKWNWCYILNRIVRVFQNILASIASCFFILQTAFLFHIFHIIILSKWINKLIKALTCSHMCSLRAEPSAEPRQSTAIISHPAHKSDLRPRALIGQFAARRSADAVIGRSAADVTAGENILGWMLRAGTIAARPASSASS